MYTHQDYIQGKCTHEEYYGQFVNQSQKALILRTIELEKLLTSEDKSFNDIPLKLWDSIGLTSTSTQLLRKYDSNWSLAIAVCINKACATQIVEDYHNANHEKE